MRCGWPILTSRHPDGFFLSPCIQMSQLNRLHRGSHQKWEIVPPLVADLNPLKTNEKKKVIEINKF